MLGLGLIGALADNWPVEFILALSLLISAFAIYRLRLFTESILSGPDRITLFYFPVADGDYLRYRWTHFLRVWLAILAVWFAVCYAFAVSRTEVLWPSGGYALGSAAVQTACALCFAIWLHILFPGLARFFPEAILAGLAVGLFLVPEKAFVAARTALFLIPAHWVGVAFIGALRLGPTRDVWWFLPALVFSASLPWAWRRLNHALFNKLEWQVLVFRPSAQSRNAEVDIEENQDEPAWTRANVTLDSGFRLAECGLLERLAARLYNDHELTVAEFLVGYSPPRWSKKWLQSAAGVAVAMACALVPSPLAEWAPWVFILGAAIWGMPIGGGDWPGFGRPGGLAFSLPIYMIGPLDFGDMARVLLKANALRVLAWFPLAAAFAAAVAPHSEAGFWDATGIALKWMLALAAWQFITLTAKFSQTTNEASRGGWHVLAWFGGAVILAPAAFAGAAFMFLDKAGWAAGGAVLMVASFALLWLSYLRLLNRGRIDLLSVSP